MNATRTHLSLNGEWRLALDAEDVGKAEDWFAKESVPDALAVTVPSVWDIWAPGYDGVGWYFREFEFGEELEDRCAALHFEAADYHAEVWLNGTRLGEHEGGYTPFDLDATESVQQGTNRVAVRIVDPHGPEGYGDFKPKEIPCSKEGGYWSFAGLWGGVSLETKPRAHIVDVFVQPDIRRRRVTATVTASASGIVRVAIKGTPYQITGGSGKLVLPFPEHDLWSPRSPKLYTLQCSLLDGEEVLDSVDVRFGMREFTVKEGRFFLNNRPIFIKGVLHQPDYARSLAAPETPELARRELELAKDAGFNLVRLHIKTAPRITLDLADEIGLLIYAEPPIGWIKKSAWMKDRCEREVREMVLRDRNHPSVVIWGMLNESGNADYVTRGGAQTIKDGLCELARSLDPSRIVIDDSGGVNGTRETSRMMRPYHHELEPYDDLHIYQRAPVDRDIELYYTHSGTPGMLYFLSEFGFGGMEDLADVIEQYGEKKDTLKDAVFLRKMLDASREGFDERNLGRMFGDFSGLTAAARELQCDAVRFQVDACRGNPKLAGYCYTQLCDAGHEFCAGVLDRWRRPKPVFETLKQVQRSARPLIHIPRTNLVPREEVPVSVTLTNEDRLEGYADLSLQVIGPTNQVLWKKKRNVKIPRPGRELWSGRISASGSPGVHKFAVRLMQGMKVLAENAVELNVFEPAEACGVEVNVLDPKHEWQHICAKLAKSASLTAPIHIVPPLANSIRAYPDNELAQILAQVKGGTIAIIFSPPGDWNDLAARMDTPVKATSKDAVGAFLGVYHYVKLHPVFDGLPSRGLMRQPYRNIVPPKTFWETSDEDICGTFDTHPIAAGNYMVGETDWWGSDILVRRYGAGRLVFTHLRIIENLGTDPVADRLFVNMLKHFARRSVPSEGAAPLHAEAVEWLRKECTEGLRRWMVAGEFPNWDNEGHETDYPPEREINFDAAYPGWYAPVKWKPWYARAGDEFSVDLQEAFSPIYEYYPRFDCATAYAYAEFNSDARHTVSIRIGIHDAMKVWVNSILVHENDNQVPHDKTEYEIVPCNVRQGRNTVLVKVSKIPGPFRFSLGFKGIEEEPVQLTWWK